MLFPQCTFFVTAVIRMFQMAGQVCWVTLGGIQPTGVPPPVLRPYAVSWHAHRGPSLASGQGEAGAGVSPPWVWYPLVACLGIFAPWALYRGR